jgi:hypothetical protein
MGPLFLCMGPIYIELMCGVYIYILANLDSKPGIFLEYRFWKAAFNKIFNTKK